MVFISFVSSEYIQYHYYSARIFNIYPKKGAILPGSDADIIILNPISSFEISARSHHSRSDTNVYEGRKGKVGFLVLFFIHMTIVHSNCFRRSELYDIHVYSCLEMHYWKNSGKIFNLILLISIL